MEWNRSNALGLAKATCFACKGLGIRTVRKDKEVACNCVFRAVFRACFNRFRQCAILRTTSVRLLEFCSGRKAAVPMAARGRNSWRISPSSAGAISTPPNIKYSNFISFWGRIGNSAAAS